MVHICISEQQFRRMLSAERRRTDRSGNSFLLLMLNFGNAKDAANDANELRRIAAALCRGLRETDIIGWYKQDHTVATIFTEIPNASLGLVHSISLRRIRKVVEKRISPEVLQRLNISFHGYSPSKSVFLIPPQSDSSQKESLSLHGNDSFGSELLGPSLRKMPQVGLS